MKICFINPVRELGAGERWLLGLAAALRARNHEVSLFCRPAAIWRPVAEGAGLVVLPLPMVNDLSLRSIQRVRQALRETRPEVVVCCNQRALRLGGPAAWLAGRIPVIFRVGLAGALKNHPYNRWLAARAVSRFVVNARALAEELAGFGWIDAARVEVIYSSADAGFYQWHADDGVRERWCLPADSLVVLASGRLLPGKGNIDLVRVAALLREEFPRLRVVILGRGPEEGRIRPEISSLGLEETVRLLGTEADMPAALGEADLFCHPPRRESLPNGVLEAMAAGVPVVATGIDGIPEIIENEHSGLLVPPGDPRALAATIRRLLEDTALRANLARRGRIRAEYQFSLSDCRARWEALLAGVLAERQPPALEPGVGSAMAART